MKTFLLLVLITDFNDTEHLDQVNSIVYKDKLSCLADKAYHSKDSVLSSDDHEVKSIQYFCADSLLYKKKVNKE
jgi:hypothetical protein